MTKPAASRIDLLTSWRGIFSICIVIFHCRIAAMTEITKFSVVFFFMVSGFLMAMKYHKADLSGRDYGKFLGWRALRLYTHHWVALAVYVVLVVVFAHGRGANWDALLPNALFVHIFSVKREVIFSFNGHMWFLGDLLLCYALYPVLSALLRRLKFGIQLLMMLSLMAVVGWVMGNNMSPDLLLPAYVFPPVRIYEFAWGIVLYACYARLRHQVAAWSDARVSALLLLVMCSSLLLMVMVRYAEGSAVDAFNEFVLWEIPVMALILTSAFTAGRCSPLIRLLTCRPLMWLAEISLEIYVLQAIAGLVYNYMICPVLGHFGYPLYEYYPVGIFFPLIPMAYLWRRYISIPLNTHARQKFV